jgi:hypothetical protein
VGERGNLCEGVVKKKEPIALPCPHCGERVFMVFDSSGEEVFVDPKPERGPGLRIEYALGEWYGTRVLPSPSGDSSKVHAVHVLRCQKIDEAERTRLLKGPRQRRGWKLDSRLVDDRRGAHRFHANSTLQTDLQTIPGTWPEHSPAPKQGEQLCFFFTNSSRSSTHLELPGAAS